jgi:hypothetical protein
MVIEFLKIILEDFPDEKLDQPIGKAKSPLYFMKHIAGTASFWMRKIDREFKHRMRVEDKTSFFEKLEKQLSELKDILENDDEITWQPAGGQIPHSVPWIAVRSANHAMHHASMLIIYRHYYGLGPLNQTPDVNWGKIVDLPGNLNY